MPESQSSTIPRWQSHKQVAADRITGWSVEERPGDSKIFDTVLLLSCGAKVKPRRKLETNGADIVGGYYMLYDDGYESWSPAKAFEDGYTRLPGQDDAGAEAGK